jgi:hypothetical protein
MALEDTDALKLRANGCWQHTVQALPDATASGEKAASGATVPKDGGRLLALQDYEALLTRSFSVLWLALRLLCMLDETSKAELQPPEASSTASLANAAAQGLSDYALLAGWIRRGGSNRQQRVSC